MNKLLLALFSANLILAINSAAMALPGDKTQRIEQIMKHHAFFPSSGFGRDIGEVGPIRNSRELTDNRVLVLEAFYDVHADVAKTIQYEQVSVIRSSCSGRLEMETYLKFYSDKTISETRSECLDGAALDFHLKDEKAIKALELAYGTSSPIHSDYKNSKIVKTANQYFYFDYDHSMEQRVRRSIGDIPIPFSIYKGNKFTYVTSPYHVMIVKPDYSFKQAYADWAKDEQLFKQLKSDQQKQKPYEL